jgi:hypothetical protein
MPAKSIIAEQVVKFTVAGLEVGYRATASTVRQITNVVTAGAGLLRRTIDTIQAKAPRVFAAGSAFIGGFLFKAAQGTQEGTQFSQSMELLARVIGNELAPVLRIITAGVLLLVDGIKSLDPETKNQAALFITLATAVAGVLTILPTLATIVGGTRIAFMGLGTVIAFLVSNPIGWIVLALAAIVVALVAVSDSADDLADRIKPAFAVILKMVKMVELAFTGLWFVIKEGAKQAGAIMDNLLNGRKWDEGVGGFWDKVKENEKALDQEWQDAQAKIDERAGKGADAVAKRLWDIRKMLEGIGGEGGFKIPGMEGLGEKLKDLWKNASGPMKLQLKAELESPAQSWDRIQKAFANGQDKLNPQLDGHLNQIKRQLGDIVNGVKGGVGNGLKMGE